MAFCSKCGAQVPDGTAFCTQCGNQIAAPAAYQPPPPPPQPYQQQGGYQQPQQAYPQQPAYYPPQQQQAAGTTGLDQNVAGLLCYVLWWLTGIIFLIIDKRPFVKFHAAQSIVVFGGLQVLQIIVWTIMSSGWFFGTGLGFMSWGLGGLLSGVLWLLGVILWILLMIKAYQGEMFHVPIAGGIADSLSGNK